VPSLPNIPLSLDRSRTATELTDEVQRIFAQIGECWVKTRFDAKNIPVAFAQYKVRAQSDLHLMV